MPEIEAILTTAPLPCRSMCGSTYLQVRNMLLRFTALTRSQLSSLVSTGPPTSTMPTLLWRTSTRPNAFMQASTIAATSFALLTSQATASQTPPSPSMMRLVSRAAASLRSAAKTLAPSRAKSTAVALPLPQPGPIEPAPVTSATLSLSRAAMAKSPLASALHAGKTLGPVRARCPYAIGETRAHDVRKQRRVAAARLTTFRGAGSRRRGGRRGGRRASARRCGCRAGR